MKQFIFSLFLGLAIVAVLVIPQSFSATGGQLTLWADGGGPAPLIPPKPTTGGGSGGGKLTNNA